MIQQYLQIIFLTIFYITSALLILIVLASTWLDFMNITKQKVMQKLPKNTKHQPVSIILYAYNNADSIVASLSSVFKNGYKNLQVIIIDNASTDSTVQLIRNYIKQKPQNSVQVIAKRKHGTKQQALLQAFEKTTAGSLVLTINGITLLKPNATSDLNKFAQLFTVEKYQVASHVTFSRSYVSFIKTLHQLSLNKLNVLKQHVLKSRRTVPEVFVTRYENFKNQIASYQSKEHSNRYTWQVGVWIIFMATTTYFVYISIAFQKSELIVYSFLVFYVWFSFIILSSEEVKTAQKISLLSILPVSYLLCVAIPFTSFINSVVPKRTTLTD